MGKTKHTPYFECLEALRGGGCPVCELGKRAVARYLDSLIYEQVNDPGARRRTRAAQGFCRLHAWQLRRHGGALGMAIIYRDVVRDVVQSLDNAKYNSSGRLSPRAVAEAVDRERPSSATADAVRSLLPSGQCPACATQHRTEAMYTDVFLENLEDPEIQAALGEGRGLCLPHLRLALQRVRDENTFSLLVAGAKVAFSGLQRDLDEMIRRHDYRYQEEGLGQVGDAWLDAIAQVAGKEGLS